MPYYMPYYYIKCLLFVNALSWVSCDNLALKRPADFCEQVAFVAEV